MSSIKSSAWSKAIKASADPKRARHFLDLLAATKAGQALKKYSAEEVRVLVAVFSGSQWLSSVLLSKPEWLSSVKPDVLRFPRRRSGLFEEVKAWFEPLLKEGNFETALARLRIFNQNQMLRVGARDLAWPGNAKEIAQEISDIADVCLESIWQICWSKLTQRYGQPWHQDATGEWQRTFGCLIGLGKLGGQELNYSSDVDVIFVYEEEGSVFNIPGPRSQTRRTTSVGGAADERVRAAISKAAALKQSRLTNHQFFNRIAEAFVAEVTRLAPEGMLYRIDLRLRPEGDAGPLTRSLAGYENYYAQWGQTWERMMLIKARRAAGDERIAAEFLEMVQPFRYPRSVNQNVLSEVAAMKGRIENEVVKEGEVERNVKLGRGGIREIEFIAQVLQLLNAGRHPFLQGPQTLACLDKLVQYELLKANEARSLGEAYRFLRDVEHRLQMESNRQTHTIPEDGAARERLARLMACSGLKAFETTYRKHTAQVRLLFDDVIKVDLPQSATALPYPQEFKGMEEEWKSVLIRHGFKDIPKAFRVLREFVEGPGYVHVSSRTKELAYQIVPRLLAMCAPELKAHFQKPEVMELGSKPERRKPEPRLSDPDRVVTRLDSFLAVYGARATLFEVWNTNPALFELLVLLFDRSEFLAEMAIRTPDLVDELVMSGRLRQRKSAEETLRDLRHGLKDADQERWLRRYHQAELMRIGLRDILGLAQSESFSELSALADACLQYALEVVMRRNRLKKPPFAIVGLGKLGGQETDYGSDLDMVFVADSGAKNLNKLGRFAVEVMDLVSVRTEDGLVFLADARLRPDGEKGLLVNTLAAYEQYYRRRGQLWEIQSLTRTRLVAGDRRVGEGFQKLAGQLTNFGRPSLPLAAYTPNWKEIIHRMRLRIQTERTPRGMDQLAIKTGKGGLMDVEFIAQSLCLENGWQEPNTLHALQRGRASGKLIRADELIENYRRLLRVEGILRRWSYAGETVLPNDAPAFGRVTIRCGFDTPEAFREMIANTQKVIADVYSLMFGTKERDTK